jgi:hypothetical protein
LWLISKLIPIAHPWMQLKSYRSELYIATCETHSFQFDGKDFLSYNQFSTFLFFLYSTELSSYAVLQPRRMNFLPSLLVFFWVIYLKIFLFNWYLFIKGTLKYSHYNSKKVYKNSKNFIKKPIFFQNVNPFISETVGSKLNSF